MGEVEVWLHSFLMEMSGEIHVPAALPLGKEPQCNTE
jgi:hypothetical protein